VSADSAGLTDEVRVELNPAGPALPPAVDGLLYLQGDEDCDVSVQCRGCDKGGEPVIWYTVTPGLPGYAPTPNPYDEARVWTAHTTAELFALMVRHVREVHGEA
jgi:hypothetical protein